MSRLTLGAGLSACISIALTQSTATRTNVSTAAAMPVSYEHSYRVVGRAGVGFVSWSADDIGGARLVVREAGGGATVSMLVGSEPERAPRNLNEWGYTFERIHGERSESFVLRSVTPADLVQENSPRMPTQDEQRQFRAICASTIGSAVQSVSTTVRSDRVVTYRGVGALLDGLSQPQRSQRLDVAPPTGAAPGFLTALTRLLRGSVGDKAAVSAAQPPVPYVYNSAVYDLQLRRKRLRTNVSIGGQTYAELLRSDFVTVRRRDNDQTAFTVTYPVDGANAGVPLVVTFRPHWWLTIELQQDDKYDVPADPATNVALTSRIRELCSPVWAAQVPE
jgi:hypothetical protein